MATPTVNVTGNFENILGAAFGSVSFQLFSNGFGGPYRVSGTGTIVQTRYQTSIDDSFSVTLFGNDVITPGPDLTFYLVIFYDEFGVAQASGVYQFDGSDTIDISTVTPINTSLPVPIPILSIAQGGTGTNNPSLIAGNDITITGSWPDQTVTFTGGGGGGGVFGSTFSNQTSLTVTGATHGLGTADLIVAIYDSATGTRNLVIPDSVSIDSSTFDVTVAFELSQSGRIVIQG